MIERTEIDGSPATVAYLTTDFEPATPATAEMVKVIFDDGRVVFAHKVKKQVADYDPEQPRDPKGTGTGGRWTTGAETLVAAPKNREEWPEHAKALKVPPAWTDVRINSNPHAALQATGKDAKGRSVYIYSEEFRASQSAVKFARIQELAAKAKMIRDQNEINRRSDDSVTKDHADVTALIMSMGIRPGSDDDTKAKVKAYGATTLEGRHVVNDGDETRLVFTGKKGVHLDLPVTDPDIARMLKERASYAGKDGKLFPLIDDASLRDYTKSLDGGGFKTKDFRTYLGTSTAARLVAVTPEPKNFKEYKSKVHEIGKAVSSILGNTPTIALQSYIDPRVFAPWRKHAPT
jgi:DNA topoisomerase-1